jgi:hypothetical protein
MKKYALLTQKSPQELSDKDYLNKYIECADLFYPNGMWSIKDCESALISTTLIKAKMIGFNKVNDTIGLKDEEMPCKNSEIAETFYSQDREVRTTRKNLYMLDVHEYCTGLAFLKTIKTPIVSPGTGNLLGTFGHCTPFTPSSNLKTILDIHGIRFGKHSSMKIINDPGEFKLTEIERDVLFCICLGVNSRKDIACLLSAIYKKNVSAETTVNDTFRRLYEKLDCNSPTQLLAFAEYNQLNLQIPKSFFPTGSFILS